MAILKNQIYSVNMSSFSSKFFCGAVRARPNKLLICHKSWHLLRFFQTRSNAKREREWELSKPTCYFCTGKTWLSFSLEKIVKQSSKENRKRKQIILVCASIPLKLVTFWKVTNPCGKTLIFFLATRKVTNLSGMLAQNPWIWKVTNPRRMLAHYIVCKHSTWIGDFSSGQKLFQCFSTWIGDFSKSHQFEWNACAYIFTPNLPKEQFSQLYWFFCKFVIFAIL